MVSGPKVLLVQLESNPGPVLRQIPVVGSPMKVIYSQALQCLVVAVLVHDRPTLAFIHPDTGLDIGWATNKDRESVEFIGGLGKVGDKIHGLSEWQYSKEGRIWRYLIVTTHEGRLVVVSAEVDRETPRADGLPTVRYCTRFHKRVNNQPIYSAIGHEDNLIYCAGHSIHWEILDSAERRIKPVRSFELGSPATSLQITNGKLMALTMRESLEIFDYAAKEGSATGPDHVDPKQRHAVHMMEVAGLQPDDAMASVVLVADQNCEVGGLWVPWQVPGKDCEPVFEAELPASIRRFRRGRARPVWEQGQHVPKYGRLISTTDDADILGIALDGSIQHFTLISKEIWRVLRFIQNMAALDKELCPFSNANKDGDMADPDFDLEPRFDRGLQMHVDGDLLRRCLAEGAVERLLTSTTHYSRLREFLHKVEDGQYTRELAAPEVSVEEERRKYIGLVYAILDYYMRPIM